MYQLVRSGAGAGLQKEGGARGAPAGRCHHHIWPAKPLPTRATGSKTGLARRGGAAQLHCERHRRANSPGTGHSIAATVQAATAPKVTQQMSLQRTAPYARILHKAGHCTPRH